MLRIQNVYPGSRIRLFSIPHPGSQIRTVSIPDPGSASKNLTILTPKKPKKWFLSSRKYDPCCSSRIPDPDADFLPIPDPGSRIQKGTGSWSRIRNTANNSFLLIIGCQLSTLGGDKLLAFPPLVSSFQSG